MSRSIKKGPYLDQRLVKKMEEAKKSGNKKIIQTWSRNCTIIPDFVGQSIGIHNGMKFIPVYITENMVGHKLGEFSHTRTFRAHSGQRSKIEKEEKGAKKG